jgi:plasmid stabilization system protein ParE
VELTVRWTKRAQGNFQQVLAYIQGRFGQSAAQNYMDKVLALIEILKSFPELGIKQKNGLYAIILYKRTTILYSVSSTELILINVVDNRLRKD